MQCTRSNDSACSPFRDCSARRFKLALQKARQAKNLTQGDLAKLINVTQKVIQDYESGKAVPIGNIINLLNRKLEVVLPKIPKIKKAKVDRTCTQTHTHIHNTHDRSARS